MAAIPPSPSCFVQKGCHFTVTRALLLDSKSSVLTRLKIKHVQGSMDLGLPTEYYLATRSLTTLLFFKINIMSLLNPLAGIWLLFTVPHIKEKSILETTMLFCKANLPASCHALQNLTSHSKAD